MPSATINGIELYYELFGSGPPIFFIHGGYGGLATSLVPLDNSWVDKFQDSYTVVTYDRRSAGKSSYPDTEHTLDLLTDDLVGLMGYLNFPQGLIIGSSAGGPIAINLALKHPNLMSGLILVNTSASIWSHPGRKDAAAELRRRYNLLKDNGTERAFELIHQNGQEQRAFYLPPGGSGPRPPERAQVMAQRELQIKELTEALGKEDHIRYEMGALRNQAAYLDVDLTSQLADISISTLVVHGDADRQVPYELGKELSRNIPGASFVSIPGAGHGLMGWEDALSAIREFCDGLMD